ncbi:MAG: hypothetical protein K1X81_01350 [Bacteroidia bacterium]|nr:hypothetical protein [Bacteroidia bacterium]
MNLKVVSLTAFALLLLSSTSMSQCTSLIQNRELTGTINCSSGNCNEFAIGNVPSWQRVTGTAQLGTFFHTAPTTGLIWGLWVPAGSANPQPSLSTESFGQVIGPLIPGRKYLFSVLVKKSTLSKPRSTGTLNVMLCNNAGIPPNGFPTNGGWVVVNNLTKNNRQIIASVNPPDSHFVHYQVCFTPTNTWNFIILYVNATRNLQTWYEIDDVELYQMKPDAGPDTSICNPGCVDIGRPCNLQVINLAQTFSWTKSGNSTSLGTTVPLHVCPSTTETYVLKQATSGCLEYDTVVVKVNQPFSFNLGNDTVLCGGSLTLSGPAQGYLGNTYNYNWSTGESTRNITIQKSGVYILRATTPGGCSFTDTIRVTIRPEITIAPKDTIVCSTSLPLTLTVTPGYQYYSWSNGSTTNTTQVYSAGTYIVTVTDSGCTKTDTSTVSVWPPDFSNLGPDIYKCPGDSVSLCGPNGIYKFLWSTGDTTRCITVSAPGTYWIRAITVDSCIDYDTIVVYDRPVVQINFTGTYGPYCYSDTSAKAISVSPAGGVLSGSGITGNAFYPMFAGAGLHRIMYEYTDSNGCISRDSVFIRVHPPVEVEITPITPFCPDDPPATLLGYPTGGTWSGITNNGVVDPINLSPNTVYVAIYSYTDSNGCTGTDTAFIEEVEPAEPNIVLLDSIPCADSSVVLDMVVNVNGDTSNYEYYWYHTGDTTRTSEANGNGTYVVRVMNRKYQCEFYDTLVINLPNCCDYVDPEPTAWVLPQGNIEYWDNQTKVFSGIIIVDSTAQLFIRNSNVFMLSCSKIIVHRGGRLVIENSIIQGCKWYGIEVWGHYDACQTLNTNDPYSLANLIPYQGYLRLSNSEIIGADIGVFAGRREDQLSPTFIDHRMWGGGVLDIESSRFRNNYVDIVFSEYDAHGMMCDNNTGNFSCAHEYNISWVRGNEFFPMRNNSQCDTFVTSYLLNYGFTRCHILVSSDNIDVWSIPNNMPIPPNNKTWPCVDYLKGEPRYKDHGFSFWWPPQNTFSNGSKAYQCIQTWGCRIDGNVYHDACSTLYHLK